MSNKPDVPDTTGHDDLSATIRQNGAMRAELALISDDVSTLARVLTGDNVQPSGRWGSTHEMLQYLIGYARGERG